MILSELVTILKSTGLLVTYYQWPKGGEPPLPYLVYIVDSTSPDTADNEVWQEISGISVELYEQSPDFALLKAIKKTLSENGIIYSTESTYIQSEEMYQTTFYLQEVIDYGE